MRDASRRLLRRASVAAVGAGLLAVGIAACQPASPSISLSGSTTATIVDGATATFTFRCTAKATCTGSTRLKLAGINGTVIGYSVLGGATKSIALPVSAAQLAKVPAGATAAGEVRVHEASPAEVAARGIAVKVENPVPVDPKEPTDPEEPETPTSYAYRERNWTPTAIDTCSAELHRRYSVVGPDGKLYPTWHPATVVDPATGEKCTFGHEHGDDPTTSDIYEWVTDFLDADPSASRGIPFGYVSEALDAYSADHGTVTRHEDNVGHKIIVANDVKMVSASPRGYVRDADGAVVTCDYLIKVHQGSHSGDALANNAHELLYAVKCTDGTGITSSTLTRFGDANEFNRSCDGALVPTAGSNLPDGIGGSRLIPDRACIDRDVLVGPSQTSSIWALYEVWRSENLLRTSDGTVLASFDPWFGVRNPARAHAGGTNSSIFDLVDVTDLVDSADGGTAHGHPFDEVSDYEAETGTQLAKGDPHSPFDGAQRDFYLHRTTVDNAGGATTWYTDPYGEHATTVAAPGLVRQYLSATSNVAWPDLKRRSFALDRDFGHDNGVHAPN